jgi:hypothetical protein
MSSLSRHQRNQRHRRSASLFALLLLVPLIHGAGSHLGEIASAVHSADDLARSTGCHSADIRAELSAPVGNADSHFAGHAAGEFCTLCVTTRSAWARPASEGVSSPANFLRSLPRIDDVTLRSDRPRGRPEAPRAPPQQLA